MAGQPRWKCDLAALLSQLFVAVSTGDLICIGLGFSPNFLCIPPSAACIASVRIGSRHPSEVNEDTFRL